MADFRKHVRAAADAADDMFGVPCATCGKPHQPILLNKAGDCAVCEATAMKKSPTEARAAAKRKLAAVSELRRRRLLPFVEAVIPDYTAGWFHRDLCIRLEKFSQAVVEKESPRLMLMVPPRHGKTVVSSQAFPAWHMGRNPRHEIMATSYGAELAENNSRQAMSMVGTAAYKTTFPHMERDGRSQAVGFWRFLSGASYLAAGVGGAITGRGAHVAIVDDPVKNREEADSITSREKAYNWYTSTLYTRLAPGGGVLVIQTRWHDDDLAGRLLEDMRQGADQWEVVLYPALAVEDEKYRKRGEALHPERYPQESLKKIKNALPARDWSALYQQTPVSDSGEYFRRDDFREYTSTDLRHDHLRFYTVWDLAVAVEEENDYTVGLTGGVDHKGDIYIVDLVRGKWRSHEIVEKIIAQHKRWKARITGIEASHVELAVGPYLDKRRREDKIPGLLIERLKHGRRDKLARARAVQGRLQQGKVYVPVDKAFTMPLIEEMLRFPAGKHDDQVDAMAWMGKLLDRQRPPPDPAKMHKDRERKLEKLIREEERKKRKAYSLRKYSAMRS